MPQILFAEDEAVLGKLVKEALERDRTFKVEWVKNGKEALDAFGFRLPDICILDVMMPLLDGFAVAKEIRRNNKTVPILFLTARSQTEDLVRGFEAGGNDYLRKPFSIEELVLRVQELIRRQVSSSVPKGTPDSYHFGAYEFNAATQVLRCTAAKYQLSGKEAALLEELLLHKNSLLERKAALLKIWGDDSFFQARNMDVYIARLRKYLVHDAHLSIINIRGYGFKLVEE
jgi:DNA-binding response OmpR family regulator